jgi:hypothetical protein
MACFRNLGDRPDWANNNNDFLLRYYALVLSHGTCHFRFMRVSCDTVC